MQNTIIKSITNRFKSYEDIISNVEDGLITKKLDVPKNKSLKDHYWCVVGARESYIKAIELGKWSGFNCSLKRFDKKSILKKLENTSSNFIETVDSITDWDEDRAELLVGLLEHEVMHEGQIIRHMYALEESLPKSCKWA